MSAHINQHRRHSQPANYMTEGVGLPSKKHCVMHTIKKNMNLLIRLINEWRQAERNRLRREEKNRNAWYDCRQMSVYWVKKGAVFVLLELMWKHMGLVIKRLNPLLSSEWPLLRKSKLFITNTTTCCPSLPPIIRKIERELHVVSRALIREDNSCNKFKWIMVI